MVTLNASTMYLLTKIQKAYPVVEVYSKVLAPEIKEEIMESLRNTMEELEIDTSGYSYRTLAFIISDSYIGGDIQILNIELVLGEEIKRLDDSKEVYALTYRKAKQLIVKDKDEDQLSEETIDSVDSLLVDFSQQYTEDNE
jgi:hypothetical protein